MREVLFKAKRVDYGEWVEGFYFQNRGCKLGEINTGHFIKYDTFEDEYYEIDPETLCEYIGIKDMKGELIFENDILQIKNRIGTVEFSTKDVWSCDCCNESFDGTGFICRGKYGLMNMEDGCAIIIGNKFNK